jgi:hypothetical protein
MTTIPVDFPNPGGADPEPPIPFPEDTGEAPVEISEGHAFMGGPPAQFSYMGFQQPMFDAEYVVSGISEMRFFERQLGNHFAYGGVPKTDQDTNMMQSGCLCAPLVLFLKGFVVNFQDDITPEEKNILLSRANFEFCGHGNRLLLRLPLRLIYENKQLRDLRRSDGQLLPSVAIQRRPEQPVDFPTPEFSGPDLVTPQDFQESLITSLDIYDRCYRLFPNPNQRMRINYLESFNAKIRWAAPLPEIRRLRIECYMVGTLLVPR